MMGANIRPQFFVASGSLDIGQALRAPGGASFVAIAKCLQSVFDKFESVGEDLCRIEDLKIQGADVCKSLLTSRHCIHVGETFSPVWWWALDPENPMLCLTLPPGSSLAPIGYDLEWKRESDAKSPHAIAVSLSVGCRKLELPASFSRPNNRSIDLDRSSLRSCTVVDIPPSLITLLHTDNNKIKYEANDGIFLIEFTAKRDVHKKITPLKGRGSLNSNAARPVVAAADGGGAVGGVGAAGGAGGAGGAGANAAGGAGGASGAGGAAASGRASTPRRR
jgi:hypothetical protein